MVKGNRGVMIKFISYDGTWPSLCYGTLVLEIDGVEVHLEGVLTSGGSAYFTDNYGESHIENGDWIVHESNLPDDLKYLRDKIVDIVNDNIEMGCCGGCL